MKTFWYQLVWWLQHDLVCFFKGHKWVMGYSPLPDETMDYYDYCERCGKAER